MRHMASVYRGSRANKLPLLWWCCRSCCCCHVTGPKGEPGAAGAAGAAGAKGEPGKAQPTARQVPCCAPCQSPTRHSGNDGFKLSAVCLETNLPSLQVPCTRTVQALAPLQWGLVRPWSWQGPACACTDNGCLFLLCDNSTSQVPRVRLAQPVQLARSALLVLGESQVCSCLGVC